MKSFDSTESRSFSYFAAAVISVSLHLFVLGALFVFARFTKEPPPAPPMTVTMLSEPEPVTALKTNSPAPEPPKPEPPKPEPPKPEPPKPEPPKPVPPKPEPKPKPKPKPKPEPPKPVPPKPKPVPPPDPVSSVRDRFRDAQVKSSDPVPPRPLPRPVSNPSDIRKRLERGVLQQRVTTSSAYSSADSLTAAQRLAAAESVNYADQHLNAFISPLWHELGPNKGDLGNQLPSPVKVEFTVLEDGRVVGIRISERSNSAAMNQAAEKLIARLRRERLPSLSSVGIKSKSLPIVLFLETRS
jgi:TonB family protein